MSFFLRRKLIDWGFVEPNIYDIMNKYVRGYLTEEQIKSLEGYGGLIVDNDVIKKDWDNRFYFELDCEIIECMGRTVASGRIPSCDEFRSDIERFGVLLDKVTDAISERKKEKLEQSKKLDREKKCERKMWDSL